MTSHARARLHSVLLCIAMCAIFLTSATVESQGLEQYASEGVSEARTLLAIDAGRERASPSSEARPESALVPSFDILTHIQSFLGLRSSEGHKQLFPLSKGDVAGYILTWAVLFIAAGGGIGGGGAIIPLYILFLGFGTRVAVALGNITIVGGALSNFVFNAPRRHPSCDRPLIDWDLILVMEPATILGALVGGYLNKLLPSWLTTILLAILLTSVSYKLVVRGVITWRHETIEHEHALDHSNGAQQPLLSEQQRTEGQDPVRARVLPVSRPIAQRRTASTRGRHPAQSHSPLAYTGSLSRSHHSFGEGETLREPDARGPRSGGSRRDEEAANDDREGRENAEDAEEAVLSVSVVEDDAEGEAKQKKADDLFSEKRQLPPLRLLIMILLTAIVAASDYLKGIVRCASWGYWLIVLAVVPVVLLVTFGARNYLLKKGRRKQAVGYVSQEGDVDWNGVTTLTYPAICSLAGLVAGPLMLELGVLPDVASATSATMIIFTSASASIVFLSFGGIPVDYAVACFLTGMVFTMFGQVACYMLMRALKRRSVIVFAMAALLLLSMVIVYYEAVAGTIAAAKQHSLWHFGKLCSSSPEK